MCLPAVIVLPDCTLAEAFSPGMGGLLLLLSLLGFAAFTGVVALVSLVLLAAKVRLSWSARLLNLLLWVLSVVPLGAILLGPTNAFFPKNTTGNVKDLVTLGFMAAVYLHFVGLLIARRRSRQLPPPLP